MRYSIHIKHNLQALHWLHHPYMLKLNTHVEPHNLSSSEMAKAHCTRWFKYDREKLWLVYTQSVPVIFEPPCIWWHAMCYPSEQQWQVCVEQGAQGQLLKICKAKEQHHSSSRHVSTTVMEQWRGTPEQCVLIAMFYSMADFTFIQHEFSPQVNISQSGWQKLLLMRNTCTWLNLHICDLTNHAVCQCNQCHQLVCSL
jgi:hypothetical protein